MFRTLRWRLTLWFMLLSLLVYTASSAVGIMLFHTGLTSALDDELQQLSQEVMGDVYYDQDGADLQLRVWPTRGRRHNPIKLLASVQIFDKKKHLVQEYGQQGVPRFFAGTVEVSSHDYAKRSMSTPIYNAEGKLVGYLQIQLTTKLRENATEKFGLSMALIMPLVILSLGLAGYFFAGIASRPIEKTFEVLRQFISDAGHELGTPLAIIQAATENLQDQLNGTAHEARLNIISRTTDRMSKLVQDLTLLAKVDVRSASLTKPVSTISLDRIVKACMEDFADRFSDKGVSLTASDIQHAIMIGDQDSLHRMVTNLLDNALKYTNEGGHVQVALRVVSRSVRLIVEDSGTGIPSESLPLLFDRFYRVDKSRSRAAGGFGLGLAIVKAIVEAHRGVVEVSSEVGKGTKFTIILPSLSSSSSAPIEEQKGAARTAGSDVRAGAGMRTTLEDPTEEV